RLVEGAGPARGIDAHLGFEPVQKQDVPAQAPKPQQVLEEDPGVPAHVRPLGQGSGNDNRPPHGPSYSHGTWIGISNQSALRHDNWRTDEPTENCVEGCTTHNNHYYYSVNYVSM